MKMENEQDPSRACTGEIQLHKSEDDSVSEPSSNLQQNSNNPMDVKDIEDKTPEQRTSLLEAVESSSCIPVTSKEDSVVSPPSEGELKDNLEPSSNHQMADLNSQSLSCRNVDNCEVKATRKVGSESEVSTFGKDNVSSPSSSVTKTDCTNSLNDVVENVDLPNSVTVSKEMSASLLQTHTTDTSAGSNGNTSLNVSPPEVSGDSVSAACKIEEVNNSKPCISAAEKTDSSCSVSSDAVEVTVNCINSLSSLSGQGYNTSSLEHSVEMDSSVSEKKITDKQMTTSFSEELSVNKFDNSVTRKLDISPPVQSEKTHSGKASPNSDDLHMPDTTSSCLGDTSESNLTAPTESNLSDCNNSKISIPQSFTDSDHDTVSQVGAGIIDSLDVSLGADHSEVNANSIQNQESIEVSSDNVNNGREAEQTLKKSDDSLSRTGVEKDMKSDNIHNKVLLSLDIAQRGVHSKLDDAVNSCAFKESCSQSVSKSDDVSEAGSMADITSDGVKHVDNHNTSMETDKEANDNKVNESVVTLNQRIESQEGMEQTDHLNDLTPNSCNQDHSEPCVVTCQDNYTVKVDTSQPETPAEEQHCRCLSGQENMSSESNVKSETGIPCEAGKLQHSPKEYSVADSESNSWDNSYTLHTQIQSGNQPLSSGSTQHPGCSVPGSLVDTESSNMSFASSSTSTTQPLDMGDIIKAGMDTEPVLLPEATSNVEDGSGAQLAVDEWCFKQAGASKQQGTEHATGVDSMKFNSDNVPMEYEDLEFDWEEYMEDTKSTPAPDAAFPHVEASLRSNFEKGMKFEVAHGTDNKYWIATVVMPCGQLLRLRYDGSESDSSKDFWCDAFTSDIHPLGWCRQNNKTLEPPDDLKEKFPDWHNYVQTTLAQATTASDKLLGGVLGTAAVDQIKQNMLVEVQDENDLTHVWIARVLENIGGRLLLRYEGTDSARQDFWLFYLHFRIHPMGWAKEMEISYGPPEAVAEEWSRDEGWKAVLEKAQNDAQTLVFPADVLGDQEMVLDHAFKQGWKLEVLHPVSKNRICPGTVIQVYNDTYFLVQIDDHEPSLDDTPVQICCHGGSRNIFPINWAEKQGLKLEPPHGWQKEFDWQSYLKEMEAEPAPPDVFTLDCDEVKLEKGMKLEAANPEQPGQICVATVMQVNKPLVLIHLESSAELNSYHMVDCQSQEIFPVGWCESNSYPLQPPNKAFFTRRQKKSIEEPPPTTKKSSSSSHSKSHHGDKGGIWCPKIYFNHRCFSGPYLSKGRIAELPKSVGPGPVTLVMKEVLSMLINVAYKSSRVLRELQMDGDPDPCLHQQVLKAKYKGKSYRAVVELCKTSDQVVDFCKNICIKLECCPYLFSPTFINGQCPENCSQQSKTKYTAYVGKKKKKVGRPPGGHSNLEGGPKKPGKRRKRKRIGFFKVKKTLSNPELSTKDEEVDELESALHEESSNSTTASLDLVSSNGIHRRKRKYTRHVAPPLEMKTRGVKLPRYSIERRTRQPRLQFDSPGKAGVIDTAGTISELQLQQAGRKSAFVPVKRESSLVLSTNPLLWSVGEVVEYIKTTDCAPLARLFKEEEIDGQALLLLTLPTVQELMEVKLGPAIKLCHLVEKLKVAFYEQYAI